MTIALNVLSTTITTATYLASISLTLAALIGMWIANNSNIFIYGDTRPATMSIKYITLLICFLLAFSCFVQSSRWFIYANDLMSTPECEVPTEYVEVAVIRGGDFWSIGIRALYFATPLCWCGSSGQYLCLLRPWSRWWYCIMLTVIQLRWVRTGGKRTKGSRD